MWFHLCYIEARCIWSGKYPKDQLFIFWSKRWPSKLVLYLFERKWYIPTSLSLSFFFFFFLFRAVSTACGSSWARGWIRASAAGLHHEHGNTGSEQQLRPLWQLVRCWILNPLREPRNQTCLLTETTSGP